MPSAGSLLGTSKTQDFVLLAALALGGYIVYQLVQGVRATAGAVGAVGGAALAGAKALTAPVATALASAWLSMTSAGSMPALGNVIFPDGTTTPLSQLTVKQDALGNVYVGAPASGLLFQLQPSDASGNWPALQITDPSQIGQAPGTLDNDNFGTTAGAW